DAVFAGFRENIRGHVRAAEKNGMTVEEAELEDLLAVHRRRFAREPQGIARIDAAARERAARTVLVARDADGTVRAAGYFVHDERYTTYLLAAIRSLGRAGIPVLAVDHRRSALGFRSRYAEPRLAPERSDREAFVSFLHELGGGVVFPTNDFDLETLARTQDRLSFQFPFAG